MTALIYLIAAYFNLLFGLSLITCVWQRSLAPLFWVPMIAAKFLLIIAGLLSVTLGVVIYDDGRWPRLFWLWQDDEIDGVLPSFWLRRDFPRGRRAKWWWWLAVRNPVSNLKYLVKEPANYRESINVDTDLEPTAMTARWGYRFRSSGVLSSLKIVIRWSGSRYFEAYIGAKIGSPVPGVGIGAQIRPFGKYE